VVEKLLGMKPFSEKRAFGQTRSGLDLRNRHNGVVVGPFEEEEEGTGVASDVVNVQGEDPATPGPLT